MFRSGSGSIVGITTGYRMGSPGTVPVEVRFSAPVHTGPGAHPASCTMGTGSFPGAKSCRGVTMTPHLILVPWSWKGRAIPLLPLWAVRPVQNFSACTRVHSTFLHVSNPRVHLQQSNRQKSVFGYRTRSSTYRLLIPAHVKVPYHNCIYKLLSIDEPLGSQYVEDIQIKD